MCDIGVNLPSHTSSTTEHESFSTGTHAKRTTGRFAFMLYVTSALPHGSSQRDTILDHTFSSRLPLSRSRHAYLVFSHDTLHSYS